MTGTDLVGRGSDYVSTEEVESQGQSPVHSGVTPEGTSGDDSRVGGVRRDGVEGRSKRSPVMSDGLWQWRRGWSYCGETLVSKYRQDKWYHRGLGSCPVSYSLTDLLNFLEGYNLRLRLEGSRGRQLER